MKTTIEKLTMFVNQRPGLDYANYGEIKSYRREMNEITKDKHDFNELISLALRRIENLEEKVTQYLKATSGRLKLNEEGRLEYCTGQYFPTEYRPAVNAVLSSLIFADYRDEKNTNDPNPVYNTGDEIRKAIKRTGLSRRVVKNYFN